MYPHTRFTRTLLTLAGIVCLAALAGCGVTAPSPSPVSATTAPTQAATSTPAPTRPVATSGPTATPAATATQTAVPGLITKDNAADLVEVRSIDASPSWISGLSFSPVDHTFATFGLGRSVDIWDADTGKRVTHLGTQPDWGLGLAFSPDATRLVSGDGGGDVVVWNVTKNQRLAGVVAPPERVYDVEWSPDGDRFSVVGQGSSRVDIFSATGTKLQEIKTPGGWLWSTAWSKDYLAVSNDSAQKVYVYDAKTYGTAAELDASQPAGSLDFSPDGKALVGCLRTDGTIHVWDTSNWSEITSWEAHPTKGIAQGCIAGDFSRDGSVYFSGGDDGNLIAWDIATGARLKTFEYGKMVWKASMSGDGKLLAVGLDDGEVKIIGLK